MNADLRYMDYAARLGQRALGTTAENPPVGCVIVKDGRIVGLGWTQPGGRPHAETEGLAMAGEAARGATAFVTLEPCAHHGRTGPCADALVGAGIARVVTAFEDPDPRTAGKGLAILRAAGIEVEAGIGAYAAREALAGFLNRIVKKRPQVILKLALSADGKIAEGKGKRTTITGPLAQARVHLLRAQCDAVLVGLSTVLADDPELTVRLPGLEDRSPIRIIADTRLSIPSHVKLVKTARQIPVWLLATRAGSVGDGIIVIDCRQGKDGWVDMRDGLKRLAQRGINRLLVEGGAHIARSFLEANLVQRVELYRAPIELGGQGVDAFAGLDWRRVSRRFRVVSEERLGADTLTVYEKPA
jgi:diaminohydroxyphosphoribosylaminopyrimidine deaminase/5-amino-6-(5-phosphoribosylamino)uracil reductase